MSKIRCKKCEDVLESSFRHDFKYCKCGSIFVDGGNDYLRMGWPEGDIDNWIEVLEDETNKLHSSRK